MMFDLFEFKFALCSLCVIDILTLMLLFSYLFHPFIIL